MPASVIDTLTGLPVVGPDGRYVTDKSSPRELYYDFGDLIWDVGVLWRPNRRTSLKATVGERYGGMSYQGQFTWQGRNSSIGIAVFDGIESFGRMITADAAAFTGTDLIVPRNPFTGDLTGCAFSPTGGGECFNDALAGCFVNLPVARAFGMDIVWFGVLTVVAVEIGLLTPPFGVSVYTVKSALNNPAITIRDIFAGTFPVVLVLVLALVVLAVFPGLSTWLARM